jgi:signal recognition particle subunit SRP54
MMDGAEEEMKYIEAIILSMTRDERQRPKIINGSRRRRIAVGSGTSIQEVNRLLKDFDKMKKMMKRLMGGGKRIRGAGPRGFR